MTISSFPSLCRDMRSLVPLSQKTWLGVGGHADWFFEPRDMTALQAFLRHNDALGLDALPVLCMGGGSNMLVRDGGVRGVVVRLGRGFHSVRFEDESVVVGAGVSLVHLAQRAYREGRTGLAFLAGIPGTVGGALFMNAGAFGDEIGSITEEMTWVTRHGDVQTLRPRQGAFSYRQNHCVGDGVIVAARLSCPQGHKEAIKEQMDAFRAMRHRHQPIKERSGGSTFKNPDNDKAWRLIDAAGCRSMRRGDAMMSPVHCNFMINTGHASAYDMEMLGDAVWHAVYRHCGVRLQWEIQRVGMARGGQT
ncbi:MAG: UDP-N-acetylmuramate dehydrogenase [Alphaproteobacteria bacterium GM7ARS4]|nr:UDP-N-acetylmuramate dehydrogenase [Alphaproteobacteria bacterium GM7ARS4]